jgi:hypothetical protein
MKFAIRPHPKAPRLSARPQDAELILTQLINEPKHASQEGIELLREAGFVSLWFFLKVIAGYSGPYNKINDTLHLDMCNFRQSDYCMRPGAHWAAFLPRDHLKSTILTHGGFSWELLRNPDERFAIYNAIADIGVKLAHNAQRTYDSNSLFECLYPAYVPKPGDRRCNEEEFVVPNRSREYTEASLVGRGIGGKSESLHFTAITIDDPVGMDDLDVDHRANINMRRAINWCNTNTATLLDSPIESRVGWVGTRYSVDDVHSIPITDAYIVLGFPDETIKTSPNGQYAIYYRKGEENGEVTFPERFSKEFYARLKKNDYWTYTTQYQNEPQTAGMVEFFSYPTGKCRVSFEPEGWTLTRIPDPMEPDQAPNSFLISSASCVMSIDPAGTEKSSNAKLCRTAIRIWVMDDKENAYLIHSKLGFFSVEEMFDLIFQGNARFSGCVQTTLIESNAMQNIIRPLLWKEELIRKQFINPQPVMAKGDKVARIRNGLGWFLSHGKVYLTEETQGDFIEEKNQFPMSATKMDGLDADEKALSWMRKPASVEEVLERQYREEEYVLQTDNVVGY